ncbi:PAS domain S-box protein [Chloroflexota bacterium]
MEKKPNSKLKYDDSFAQNAQWAKLAFDHANDAIFVYRRTPDGDPGTLLDVNEAACRMLGYSREELLKLTMLDVSAPERYSNYAMFKEKLDAQRHFVTEAVKLTKDGRRIPTELSSYLFDLDGKSTVLSIAKDITKRKKAEDVLKESEWWHRMIVDSANDAVFVYRRKTDGSWSNFIEVNQAACDILGYSRQEFFNMGPADLLHEDNVGTIPGIRDKLLKEKRVVFETVDVKKDGSKIPMEISAHLFEINGQTIVVGVARDTTNRKKADEALRDSERRYHTLLNSAYDAVALHEMKTKGRPGKYVEVNDAFCQRVGYSRQELLKLSPWDIVENRGLARIEQLRNDIRLKKGIVFDVTELSRDGKKTPVEITARLLEIKNEKYVLSVSRDITERKRIMEDLRESEERYRMLFNSNNDAVMVHYMDTLGYYSNYIEVNDVACQILGYSREQLLDMKPRDLVAPEKVGLLDSKNTRMFSKEKHTVFETVLMSSDGRRLPVEISSHGFDHKGRHLVIAVIRDITERKQAEMQLLEAQEKLARNEKLAALGQLASGIAHDMGTPLTVIANVADFLRETLDSNDDIVKTQLDRLERQANIAEHIASDLLDFAKVRKPELEEITMDLVVNETLGQVGIPDSIKVVVEHQRGACAAALDVDQMVRVLSNLIGNAVLAMPDGGELMINTREADGYILTEIRDTGFGISAYHLNKIFEPLFTTRAKEGRTGIGLAICKSIVEAHNGVIDVTSEEHKGTTFTVKLPCAA